MIHTNGSLLSAKRSRVVTLDELDALPALPSLGSRHKPVPPGDLVRHVRAAALMNGREIVRESFAINKDGSRLFGIADLADPAGTGRTFSLGYRSSANETMALAFVAGVRVFVCDNMCLAGDLVKMKRKHTTGLDPAAEVARLFADALSRLPVLGDRISGLEARPLAPQGAEFERLIGGALVQRILPAAKVREAADLFIAGETEDTAPRSLWGLNNAFTRAAKSLQPAQFLPASVKIGRFFGLGSAALN